MEPFTSITLLATLVGLYGVVKLKSLDRCERETIAEVEFEDGYRYGFQEGYDQGYHLGGDEEAQRWFDLDDENARLRGIIGDLKANLAEIERVGS